MAKIVNAEVWQILVEILALLRCVSVNDGVAEVMCFVFMS